MTQHPQWQLSGREGLRARIRAWRLRRAEDELADAEHELRRWAFAMTPSEKRRAIERIGKADRRLAALGQIDAQGQK